MVEIEYIKGDATSPQAKGTKVIAHVCNDLGGWGKGFVLQLSRRWKEPEAAYRAWHRGRPASGFRLGAVQHVRVERYIWVTNMVAQRGTKPGSQGPPIRYDALRECLTGLAEQAVAVGASVHIPRIGCGLAGGRWERVEPLIRAQLCACDIPVTVYDFD